MEPVRLVSGGCPKAPIFTDPGHGVSVRDPDVRAAPVTPCIWPARPYTTLMVWLIINLLGNYR